MAIVNGCGVVEVEVMVDFEKVVVVVGASGVGNILKSTTKTFISLIAIHANTHNKNVVVVIDTGGGGDDGEMTHRLNSIDGGGVE